MLDFEGSKIQARYYSELQNPCPSKAAYGRVWPLELDDSVAVNGIRLKGDCIMV